MLFDGIISVLGTYKDRLKELPLKELPLKPTVNDYQNAFWANQSNLTGQSMMGLDEG